jgi:hypothetical protein
MQMIRTWFSTDATHAFPRHLNRRKRGRLENSPKPLTPKFRREAAKALEIRA